MPRHVGICMTRVLLLFLNSSPIKGTIGASASVHHLHHHHPETTETYNRTGRGIEADDLTQEIAGTQGVTGGRQRRHLCGPRKVSPSAYGVAASSHEPDM